MVGMKYNLHFGFKLFLNIIIKDIMLTIIPQHLHEILFYFFVNNL